MVSLDHLRDQAFNLQLIENFLLTVLGVNDFVEFKILNRVRLRSFSLLSQALTYPITVIRSNLESSATTYFECLINNLRYQVLLSIDIQ